MGMQEFRAASGRVAKPREDGSLMFEDLSGYLGAQAVYDAEEFFQAKRDRELGRWRYPLDPNVVVYGNARGTAFVFDEIAGDYQSFTRAEAYELGGLTYRRAARAYFEAHPERKPWHDAKPGEYWLVCHSDTSEMCRVDDMDGHFRFTGVGQEDLHVSMPISHGSITHAVRFIAEDAS